MKRPREAPKILALGRQGTQAPTYHQSSNEQVQEEDIQLHVAEVNAVEEGQPLTSARKPFQRTAKAPIVGRTASKAESPQSRELKKPKPKPREKSIVCF